jgi:hypothetical protein
MGTRLYVGNLSFQTTGDDLRDYFSQAGTVESASVVEDRETGRSRGFGFVEMATPEEAAAAVAGAGAAAVVIAADAAAVVVAADASHDGKAKVKRQKVKVRTEHFLIKVVSASLLPFYFCPLLFTFLARE